MNKSHKPINDDSQEGYTKETLDNIRSLFKNFPPVEKIKECIEFCDSLEVIKAESLNIKKSMDKIIWSGNNPLPEKTYQELCKLIDRKSELFNEYSKESFALSNIIKQIFNLLKIMRNDDISNSDILLESQVAILQQYIFSSNRKFPFPTIEDPEYLSLVKELLKHLCNIKQEQYVRSSIEFITSSLKAWGHEEYIHVKQEEQKKQETQRKEREPLAGYLNWMQSLQKIQSYVQNMTNEQLRHDKSIKPDIFSGKILMQMFLAGEINFKFYSPETNDKSTYKEDAFAKEYNFRNAYTEFCNKLEKSVLVFDVLSPQYIPYIPTYIDKPAKFQHEQWEFHNFHCDTMYHNENEHWEFHLKEVDFVYSIYDLPSLLQPAQRNLPPPYNNNDFCSPRLHEEMNEYLELKQGATEILVSTGSTHLNSIRFPEKSIYKKEMRGPFSPISYMDKISDGNKRLSNEEPAFTYDFIITKEKNGKMFPWHSNHPFSPAKCYDKRFQPYFDYLNMICSEHLVKPLSCATLFHKFLGCNGFHIHKIDPQTSYEELEKMQSITNGIDILTYTLDYFTLEYYDFVKPCSELSDSSIESLFSRIYFDNAELSNIIDSPAFIEKVLSYYESPYESFMSASKMKAPIAKLLKKSVDKERFDAQAILDHLLSGKATQIGVTYCQAKLALMFKESNKSDIEILQLFYSNELNNELDSTNKSKKADKIKNRMNAYIHDKVLSLSKE